MLFKQMQDTLYWMIREATPALSRYSNALISGNGLTGNDFIKEIINDCHKRICTMDLWPWMLKSKPIQVSSGDEYFWAPTDLFQVLALIDTDNDNILTQATMFVRGWQDPTLAESGTPSEYYIGEYDSTIQESATALAGTNSTSVVVSLSETDPDYYVDQYVLNTTRAGIHRIISASYSAPNMTLNLAGEIDSQTSGDSIAIVRNTHKGYLFPIPDSDLQLTMFYQSVPFELINDYDQGSLPDIYALSVCHLAAGRILEEKDPNASAHHFKEFNILLQKMKMDAASAPNQIMRRKFYDSSYLPSLTGSSLPTIRIIAP